MSFYENVWIGGLSGVISRTITAPLDLYKIQLQNPFMKSKSLKDVVSNEGVRHLWKGNLSNCIRVFPQQAISFPIYNYVMHSPHSYSQGNSFGSGLFSGGISTICTYPLETLRARLALQQYQSRYKGILHAIQTTPRVQWYQGIGICMFGFPLFNALSFSIFNRIPTHEQFGEWDKIIRGGFAGMGAITITYPTDLLRRRMQLQGFDRNVPTYHGVVDAVQTIYRQSGLIGFYRGLGICYIKLFPAMGIQFYCFSRLNDLLKVRQE